MREERRPMRRPTRPLSLEVALHMCQAASSGSEVKLWTPMCWDLALYVARLEAFADSITDREAALRIAGATGPLGDPEVSGDGAPGATDAMRSAFYEWVHEQGCDSDGAWSAWQGCWGLFTSGVALPLKGQPE